MLGACVLGLFSHVWHSVTLWSSWLLCTWHQAHAPDKNTGVGCHVLLQGIFLTQGSKPLSLMSIALAGGFFTTSTTREFSSVQSLSRVWLFETPWIAACQASLSITNSQSSLKLRSIESVMPSSRLILCRPLLLLPPIPPSIRVFSNQSARYIRWPKYWSFRFSTSPSNEHPGLISFRVDHPS